MAPKKLHSLSGVVPLGAFVLLHIWVTASIVGSRSIYDKQVGFLHGGPLLGLLEVVLVLVPLAYHAVYGVSRSLQPRDPDHAYDTDLMVTLQRASGIVVLVFVALHLWELRAQTWTHGLPVSSYSTKLVADLSSTKYGVPWIALGYVVGIGATVFHLVNGMTSFCTTWGYTRTVTAQRRARVVFRIAGILLFALSAAIVVQLATGTRLFPTAEPPSSGFVCGPEAASPPPPAHATPSATTVAPRPSIDAGAPPSSAGGWQPLPTHDR